jgi:hypothetical protein
VRHAVVVRATGGHGVLTTVVLAALTATMCGAHLHARPVLALHQVIAVGEGALPRAAVQRAEGVAAEQRGANAAGGLARAILTVHDAELGGAHGRLAT